MLEKTYINKVHVWGRISTLSALFMMMCIPVSICLYYNVWPDAAKVFKGLLSIVPMFWAIAVIEVITYAPMLGAGGTYLSFVTGNISNLKLPCGLNALQNANVRANTEEGEVISTIAIAASSITATLILAFGVILFAPLLPKMTADSSPFAPAFQQVLPALFGALGAGYFTKHWKISILPIAAGISVLVFAPGLAVGALIPVTVIISLLGAQIMYKKNIV